MKQRLRIFIVALLLTLASGCSQGVEIELESSIEATTSQEEINIKQDDQIVNTSSQTIENTTIGFTVNQNTLVYEGEEYTIKVVDGGDQSGERLANVAVDIGFGERQYWGVTNEYGQLIYVLTSEIIIQNDDVEPVNSDGRYYHDEADVPGCQRDDLDQGHVIADSLGGVANAYNITPQDSNLNRYGMQSKMEDSIRDAGGCIDFVATITYNSTESQIPSEYKYQYTIDGKTVVEEFENGSNYDESQAPSVPTVVPEPTNDISIIDKNGNGKVTIAEAKDAGFSMPIYKEHWLYPYMDDRDNDGMVGE